MSEALTPGPSPRGRGRSVECYSGYEYAERPTALWWHGQRMEIEEIEGRWRTPGGKCFRVRTTQGAYFDLTYVEFDDEWQIEPARGC